MADHAATDDDFKAPMPILLLWVKVRGVTGSVWWWGLLLSVAGRAGGAQDPALKQ